MVVYPVTTRSSFVDLNDFRDELIQIKKTEDVPLILVGSKCDLEYQRVVSKEEGKELARKWGCPFIECSAKTSENIEEIFMQSLRHAMKITPTVFEGYGSIKKEKGCVLY